MSQQGAHSIARLPNSQEAKDTEVLGSQYPLQGHAQELNLSLACPLPLLRLHSVPKLSQVSRPSPMKASLVGTWLR